MNNEVVELRNQLQREQQSNKDLQTTLQQEKEKAAVLERSLTLLRRNYEAFHNQAEMEEEKFVNKVSPHFEFCMVNLCSSCGGYAISTVDIED